MGRRERWSILGDILVAIDEQRKREGPDARLTNVTLRANLPYDRLKIYVEELAAAGLINAEGRMPALTERGREFLREYLAWVDVLDRFGLEGRGQPASSDMAVGGIMERRRLGP